MSPPLPPQPPPMPGLAGVINRAEIKKKQSRIPYRKSREDYRVVVFTQREDIVTEADALADGSLRTAATDSFIEHYFPEFYPFVISSIPASIMSFEADYNQLRQDILDALFITIFDVTDLGPETGSAKKIVFVVSMDLALRREDTTLPDFEIALESFNSSQGYTGEFKTVTFDMVTAPTKLEEMTGGLNSFGDAVRESGASYNMSFDDLGRSIKQIVDEILETVYNTIEPGERNRPTLQATDYVTIYFDASDHIVRIEYFFVNVTEGNTDISKVGYITNIKYNLIFQNPMNLQLLADHEDFLAELQRMKKSGGPPDIMGFFETFGAAAGMGGPLGGGVNIFSGEPLQRPFDVTDVEQLSKTIKSMISYEEVARLNDIANDPNLKSRMLQRQKAKRINAVVKVTKIIDKISSFNFPLAGPNTSKEAKIINQILGQMGIQQLISEAIACLTFGVGPAIQRITEAVRDSLLGANLYSPPRRPSDELNLERPTLSDFLKTYFSIGGDPPLGELVLNVILNALASAGFEIIKALGELITAVCPPWLADPGGLDAGEALAELNDEAAADVPEIPDLLHQFAENFGFSDMGQGYNYLSEVSKILTVIEVCRLFNNQDEVEDDTIAKIIRFNVSYHITTIRESMITGNQILSFWESCAQYVDTTTMCNDLLNELTTAAVEGCTICLDSDFYDSLSDNAAIQELISLLEEGPNIEIPPLEFACEASEFFIDNAVSSRMIPNTFTSLVDSIALPFAGSLEAARTSLLIETISMQSTPQSDALLQAGFPCFQEGVEPGDTDPPCPDNPEIDPDVIETLMEIFEKLKEGLVWIEDNLDDPEVCAELDLSRLPGLSEIGIVIDALAAGLDAAPGAIEEMVDGLQTVQSNLTAVGPGSPIPYSTYTFPEAYKNQFAQGIGYLTFHPITGIGPNVHGRWAAAAEGTDTKEYSIIKSHTKLETSGVQFEQLQINLDFDRSHNLASATDDVKIVYPPYTSDTVRYNELHYDIPLDDYFPGGASSAMQGMLTDLPATVFPAAVNYQSVSLNPQIATFVIGYASDAVFGLDPVNWYPIVSKEFPALQASTMRGIFNYILNNGTFNVAGVNNLKLFKDNDVCDPANTGDLLDADGIIDQMRKDFADAVCSDAPGADIGEAARLVIKFGIVNLLIQALIVRFIIKNVCVFSAFKMETIIDIIGTQLIEQVKSEMLALGGGPAALLYKTINEYFEARILRKSTIENEGVRHSYPGGATIPVGSLQSIEDRIAFMVNERYNYTWVPDSGPFETIDPANPQLRYTMKSVANIMDMGPEKKEFSRAFLEDVVGIYNGHAEMFRAKAGARYMSTAFTSNAAALAGTFGADKHSTSQTVTELGELPGAIGIIKEVVIDLPDPSFLAGLAGYVSPITTGVQTMTIPVELFHALNSIGDPILAEGQFAGNVITQYTLYYYPTALATDSGAGVSDTGWYTAMDQMVRTNFASEGMGGLDPTSGEAMIQAQTFLGFVLPFTDEAWANAAGNPDQRPLPLITEQVQTYSGVSATTSQGLPDGLRNFLGLNSWTTHSRWYYSALGSSGTTEYDENGLQIGMQSDYDYVSSTSFLNNFLAQTTGKDSSLISAIYYNLYLVEKYFADTAGSFDGSIQAILALLKTTEDTKNPPGLNDRAAVNNFNNAMAKPHPDMEALGKELLLKFLRETPIHIIKGLCELLDPHVIISKIIRDITGKGFIKASQAITTAIGTMIDSTPEGAPPNPFDVAGTTGDDILNLAFCGYNMGNTFLTDYDGKTGDKGKGAPLFGPDISMKGVDFTGTISGMFICPPFIFGIVYLLLKFLLDQIPDGAGGDDGASGDELGESDTENAC